jgi:hypothetical protein
MKKFSKDQWIGIVLLIAAILIWAPISFIPSKTAIGAIAVVLIGLYQLFK